MSPDEGAEEYEEANAEVQKTTLELDTNKFSDLEGGTATSSTSTWTILTFVSTIFIKSFMLTFVAEWGDRSQLTTIILAAREDVTGVILGGIAGHTICTGIAVVFGRLLARRISVRTGKFHTLCLCLCLYFSNSDRRCCVFTVRLISFIRRCRTLIVPNLFHLWM